MHRVPSNVTALVSEVLVIINKENIIMASVQEKAPLSVLNDDICNELAFLYLLLKKKF